MAKQTNNQATNIIRHSFTCSKNAAAKQEKQGRQFNMAVSFDNVTLDMLKGEFIRHATIKQQDKIRKFMKEHGAAAAVEKFSNMQFHATEFFTRDGKSAYDRAVSHVEKLDKQDTQAMIERLQQKLAEMSDD